MFIPSDNKAKIGFMNLYIFVIFHSFFDIDQHEQK